VKKDGFEHAANLAAPIAYKIAVSLGIPSFIVDPITVSELPPVAKFRDSTGNRIQKHPPCP
jgi:butyrate kinase